MKPLKVSLTLLGGALLILLFVQTVGAQVQDDNWSEPYRLSSNLGSVIGAGGRLVTDQYGFVHAFWAEGGFDDLRIIVQYARFDGENWSDPVDIYVTAPDSTFGFLSIPVIDKDDNIHIVWSMSQTGPIFYFHAPISGATSSRNWVREAAIDAPANRAEIAVDRNNKLHMVYSHLEGKEPGVYYMQSEDGGITWSQPYWLHPDKPLNYTPARVIFLKDEVTDGLHILWKYDEVIDDVAVGKQILHMFSKDAGESWSHPFIIDEADEAEDELRAGGMVFAVENDAAHVVWAGTSTTRREHRYTLDGGETWTETFRVFGELNGSAGDSIVFDGAGNVHFLGQIRFPQGMWNIRFDGTEWQDPSLVYLIRKTSVDEHEGIHVHAINSEVSSGNQLFATFTNSPSEDQLFLYVMQRTITDVEQEAILPLPEPTVAPTATPLVQRTKVSEPTPFPVQPFDVNASFETPTPADGLWLSLIPAAAFAGIVLLVGIVLQRRARG